MRGEWVGKALFLRSRTAPAYEIVESLLPAVGEEGGWRVGPEPILRIGVIEGDEAFQFHEVAGAVRLEDGTVVVADAGYREVRFFNPDGSLAAIAGGPGEGPEEFSGIGALGLGPEGDIWVYDYGLRRIAWLDHEGAFVGLTTLDPEPPTLNPLGSLPDGNLLLRQLWGAEVSDAEMEGMRRDPVAYVRFSPDGTLLDTLGLFPGREVLLFDEGGRGVMSTPPYAKNFGWERPGGRGFWWAPWTRSSYWSIQSGGSWFGSSGSPERDLALDADDREEYIRNGWSLYPPKAHGQPQGVGGHALPETRPAYGASGAGCRRKPLGRGVGGLSPAVRGMDDSG